MSITTIPFELNRKAGVLTVSYEANGSPAASGFELFVGTGLETNRCLGYPMMRAYVSAYEGTGYYTASAWIQIVTRREFASLDAAEPAAVVPSLDTHPTLVDLGVPFFAVGFPAEIFDAPCDNLNNLARLEWIADTFLVTLPSRINGHWISYVAGFRWGYWEYDLDGKRQVEINPLIKTDLSAWQQHLPLLRGQFDKWQFAEAAR